MINDTYHESMRAPLKGLLDYRAEGVGTYAVTDKGHDVMMTFFAIPDREPYAVLWLNRDDGRGHPIDFDYRRCFTPEDVKKTIIEWSSEYGFSYELNPQLTLF